MVVVNFDYAPSFGQAIIESDVMGTGVDATDCRENPCESATQENGERERTCTITDYVSKLGCITELMVADARLMPYMDNSFDILIEKGLLDSMTADSNIQISNANKLMNEYHRVLKPKGKAIIQSIFAPGDEDKDMLGLLGHTGFEIECRELLISPPERPNSAFCFIYICRKLDENQ
jgi:SAM-dependent methyltransferase